MLLSCDSSFECFRSCERIVRIMRRDFFSSGISRIRSNRDFISGLATGYGLMALTIAIQLVLVPLYLESLGKRQFGILILFLAAINYGAMGITWLSGGMARILGERIATGNIIGFARAYAFGKIVYVAYAVVAIAVFWVVAPVIIGDALQEPAVRDAVLLSCLYFVLMYEYNADRLAFVAMCRQAKSNQIEALGQVVFAIGVVAGLYWDGELRSVVLAQIAGILLTRFLAWRYWRREGFALQWRWTNEDAHLLWKSVGGTTGWHYFVYGLLLLTLQADVLILGWFAGPATAAEFYLVWRIPEVIVLLLWRIPGVFAPHVIQMQARGESERIRASYRKGLNVMMGAAALGAVGYAVFGHWLVKTWVGINAPDLPMAYLLAGAALFFVAATKWPAGIAYALGTTSPLLKVTALEVIGKLVLMALLFPHLGYVAPFAAIIATHLLGVYFLYLKMGRMLKAAPLTA